MIVYDKKQNFFEYIKKVTSCNNHVADVMKRRQKKAWIGLRELRTDRGWLQWEAAEKLGVTRAYVSALENGKRGISLHMMEAIIKTFGVKYEDFYNHSE